MNAQICPAPTQNEPIPTNKAMKIARNQTFSAILGYPIKSFTFYIKKNSVVVACKYKNYNFASRAKTQIDAIKDLSERIRYDEYQKSKNIFNFSKSKYKLIS
jgi:hypothetical protein